MFKDNVKIIEFCKNIIYNLFGDNMKKIKKKTAIIIGAISAGIIGLSGKILIDKKHEPLAQSVYGVPISHQEHFNHQFMSYEGNNWKGYEIRGLYMQIQSSNKNEQNERFVEYIGPKTSEINRNSIYTVKLEYDEEGYVCKVIVTENEKINNNNEINNI